MSHPTPESPETETAPAPRRRETPAARTPLPEATRLYEATLTRASAVANWRRNIRG